MPFVCCATCVIEVHRGQNRKLDPLELEFQKVVCRQTWMLGTEFGSSGKAVGVFNCLANSLSLLFKF